MRYIRYLFLLAIALVLVTVALANRGSVTLNSLPAGLQTFPGAGAFTYSVELPLFLVIFLGIVVGLLIGFVWEWLREHKHRAEVTRRQGEVKKLERELKRTQAERDQDKDEVLALLDQSN